MMRLFTVGALCLMMAALPGLATEGVKEIKNGITPKGKGITLSLDETLRLGPETDENFIWTGQQMIVDANKQGHIFVVDPGEKRIQELDKDGKFLRDIGGFGQGPGEFLGIAGFRTLEDDSHVLLSTNNMGASAFIFYNADGSVKEHKDLANTGRIWSSAIFSPDGKLAFTLFIKLDMASMKMRFHFAVVDTHTLEVVHEVTAYDNAMPNQQRFAEPGYWSEYLAGLLQPTGQGLAGYGGFDKDSIYTAIGKNYQITSSSYDGKAKFNFGREYKPLPLGKEELDALVEPITDNVRANLPPQMAQIISPNVVQKAVEIADFPPKKMPVGSILTTDDGHVLVLHDASIIKKKAYYDVFDKQGTFKGSFEWDLHNITTVTSLNFRDGNLYSVALNEDGDTEVVRYKYRWAATK